MKQNLFNKLWLRVGMIVAIMTTALSGTVKADEVTDVLTAASFAATSTSYTDFSNVSFTSDAVYAGNSAQTSKGGIQLRSKNSNSGIVSTTSGGKVKSVSITVESGSNTVDVYGSNTAYTAASDLYGNNKGTKLGSLSTSGTVTVSGDYAYVGIRSNNGAIYLTNITIVWEVNSSSTPTCATPNISGEESFLTSTEVSISCETTGATIYYTTDGSDPTTSSTQYTQAFTLTNSATVKAFAVKSGMDDSSVAQKAFTKATVMTVAEAKAAIDAGPSTGVENVYVAGKISQIDSYSSQYKSITYWISTDGTTTDQFEVYSGKGLNNTDFTAVTDIELGADVIVFGNIKKYNSIYEFDKNNYLVSYTAPIVAVEAPTFSPAAGTYAEAQSVTLSCETSGASIYYTTDGTEPTTSSTLYAGAITVSTTTTIKAIAIKGSDESTVTTATYHFCSAENPYTVTQALAFNEYPANGIYVTGIVSTAPTQTPTSNGQLTYYISVDGVATNQLEVYKGKGLNQAAFEAQDDIQVGDIVTIYGNVKIYNGTKEFDTDNYLVAFERPQSTDPVLSVTPAVANVGFEATNGTLDVEATNFSLDDVEEEDFQYFTYDGSDYTSSSKPEWLTVSYNGTERKISYSVTANDGEARSAYFKLALAYGEEDIYSDIITINQAAYVAPVADYATLPFEFEGGKSAIENTAGLTQSGLGSDYSSAPLLKFDGTGDYVILKINERPGVLTFDIKGNTFSGGTFKVQTSEDGETYTDVATYTTLGDTETKTISNLEASVRYIKWIYTEKVSGNVGLGNINLAQYVVLSDYTLTIDNPANVTITANYGEEVKSNGDNAEVTQGTEVTLAITPDSGYDIETVTITGAEEGQIVTPTETSSEGVYTFTMPAYDVTVSATVVEHVEPATASYVLATSITSGKTYVIANAAGTKVMGGQNSNNRAAVDATLNGTTLTAAEACEFTVEVVDNKYTFYDAVNDGYLYAASSTSNHLKTQSTLDDNGKWTIEINGETGVASVVAQGTNTRNVMQYNNGSTLFACYGSASQTAIKLYEKVEEVPTSQTVTVSDAGYATMVAAANLMIPAGVEVFAVTVNGAASSAHLEAITGGIPADEAVLVKASAGTYEFPYATEAVAALTIDNDLQAAAAAFNPTAANTIYCLAQKSGTVGFYPVATTVTIPAGKAYLEITSGEAPVKGFYGFDDDATAISSVESFTEEGAIYNLAGQRLQKMQKGINIVNGKKVLK